MKLTVGNAIGVPFRQSFISKYLDLSLPIVENLQAFYPTSANDIITFDGVNDYVKLISEYTEDDSISIEAYFKVGIDSVNTSNSQVVIGLNRHYMHVRGDTNQVQFRYDSEGARVVQHTLGAGYRDYVKFLGVYNGTTQEMLLYIDDVLVDSETFLVKPTAAYSAGDTGIGYRSTVYFDGNINYVKIWNDATQTNLIAHYDLKNSATYGKDGVLDLSGNGNHGTSYGKVDFSRSTTATYVDGNGIIRTASIDEPRFEGVDDGYLSEEQRSNLCLQSEDFTTTWTQSNVTRTANQAISPYGTLTADRLKSSAESYNLKQLIVVSASTNYVFSFYVKNNGGTIAQYSVFNQTASSNIIAATSYFSQISDTEWVRIEIPFTTPVGCSQIGIYTLRDGGNDADIYVWGAQLE